MIEFDREIVEQSGNLNKECSDRRREIKDQLRKDYVIEIASLLKEIISNVTLFKTMNLEKIVCKALEVMEKLIDWTNPELFEANLPSLATFLKNPILQTNSAKCIYSFIYKGMEPMIKLQLIDRLNLISILAEWNPEFYGQDEAFCQAVFFSSFILF